jgi:hypothetical protein
MSEEKTLTASNDAAAPGASSGSGAASTRKKTSARAASSARRGRAQGASGASTSGFGEPALASQARAQNPSLGDDPYQSGQRIWPD